MFEFYVLIVLLTTVSSDFPQHGTDRQYVYHLEKTIENIIGNFSIINKKLENVLAENKAIKEELNNLKNHCQTDRTSEKIQGNKREDMHDVESHLGVHAHKRLILNPVSTHHSSGSSSSYPVYFYMFLPNALSLSSGISGNIMPFESAQTNCVSCAQSAIGAFHAPVDGVYVFMATVTVSPNAHVEVTFIKNFNASQIAGSFFSSGDHQYSSGSQHIIISLRSQDSLSLYYLTSSTTGQISSLSTTFSGFLLQ